MLKGLFKIIALFLKLAQSENLKLADKSHGKVLYWVFFTFEHLWKQRYTVFELNVYVY